MSYLWASCPTLSTSERKQTPGFTVLSLLSQDKYLCFISWNAVGIGIFRGFLFRQAKAELNLFMSLFIAVINSGMTSLSCFWNLSFIPDYVMPEGCIVVPASPALSPV